MIFTRFRTRWLAVAGALVGALAIAGCSNTPPPPGGWPSQSTVRPAGSASASASASPKVSIKVATNLDEIKVTGDNPPTIEVPAPWGINATQTKVLKPGDGGKKVAEDDTVKINYVGVNGRTGKQFDSSFTSGKPVEFPLSGVIAGFKKGLVGQEVGSRVLIGITGPDGYDSSGGSTSAGIEVGDTLVFVVDIISVQLKAPEGDQVAQPAGQPVVSTGSGTPTVTIPAGYQPPSSILVQPIIAGKRDKVAATDTLTVNFLSMSVKTGQVIESTYGAASQSGQLSKLIACWKKGLVDQPVGSRVLLVCPPAEAYPDGNATPKVDKGDTLIYVIDILNRQAAA